MSKEKQVGYWSARRGISYCGDCYQKLDQDFIEYMGIRPATSGMLKRNSKIAKENWGEPIYQYACLGCETVIFDIEW